MISQTEDSQLIQKIVSDDSGCVLAFEAIYNRYSEEMFIYAMNIFKEKGICEDIIQNVFTDIWSRRKQLQVKNLKGYLFQSVKYQIFSHLRNRRLSFQDLTRLNIIDFSTDTSKNLEFEELQGIIDEQVSKLPSRCQQIFLLSRYEHKTNKEIALELGISIQAVKNQISKALKVIRGNLQSEEIIFYFIILSIHLHKII